MLYKGAVLLYFSDVETSHVHDEWRHIERHGFLVTTRGCLIPYRSFSNRERGSKKSVARACRAFFFGDTITKDQRKSTFNTLGWPNSPQYSHLCHDGDCGSPLCVVIEPQFRNLKRNYCGEKGTCNCGNPVKCTSVYIPSNVIRDYTLITYETPDCAKKIKALFGKYRVKILPKDHFRVEDLKRENRNERKKRGKKHQIQKKNNQKNTLDSYLQRNPNEKDSPKAKKNKKFWKIYVFFLRIYRR